ncbi:hypothetical protein Fmac_025593 [Flemingia macrophylla]|uniref:Uncharacterized protein n=1 Tax=Flemingia macrophylla TaxID=520843 RepID=A0ABD1LSN1_9FABA
MVLCLSEELLVGWGARIRPQLGRSLNLADRYVAGQRQKDWKKCSPFQVVESGTQSMLPPLVVPKFKSWSCNKCERENEFNAKVHNIEEIDMAIGTQVMEHGKCNKDLPIEDEDLLMEIAETMIKNLPNVENINCGLLLNSHNEKSTEVTEVLEKPIKESGFDLNVPYSDDIEQEMVGVETLSKDNKSRTCDSLAGQQSNSHNKSNLSDKSQAFTIFGSKLIGPSDLGDQNMIVSEQEQVNSPSSYMQDKNRLFGRLDLEEEEKRHKEENPPLDRGYSYASEMSCGVNRNPFELCPIQPENPYLMDNEDKMEKKVCKKRHGSSSNQKRKSKKR